VCARVGPPPLVFISLQLLGAAYRQLAALAAKQVLGAR